jgi:transcription elongation factor Elf1
MKCPYCGSDQDVTVTRGKSFFCDNCGSRWEDRYVKPSKIVNRLSKLLDLIVNASDDDFAEWLGNGEKDE